MSREKLRIRNTPLDNLTSNLRGEVGEIISTWVLLRHFIAEKNKLHTDDIIGDFQNPSIAILNMLTEKLQDEIIARLSELGQFKIGRLNFHFTSVKMGQLGDETRRFADFIETNKFREKRNYDISHRELPQKWTEHKLISIQYRTIVRAIAMAIRLMKKIDRLVLGPAAPFLWREARKKRYNLTMPARISYMLLPFFYLSEQDRSSIIDEEIREGEILFTEMPTLIDGKEARVLVCKKWGAILFQDGMLLLRQYPLQKLNSLNFEAQKEQTTDK